MVGAAARLLQSQRGRQKGQECKLFCPGPPLSGGLGFICQGARRRGEACASTRCASIAKALGEYPGGSCLEYWVGVSDLLDMPLGAGGGGRRLAGRSAYAGARGPGGLAVSSGSLGNPGDFLHSERASRPVRGSVGAARLCVFRSSGERARTLAGASGDSKRRNRSIICVLKQRRPGRVAGGKRRRGGKLDARD